MHANRAINHLGDVEIDRDAAQRIGTEEIVAKAVLWDRLVGVSRK